MNMQQLSLWFSSSFSFRERRATRRRVSNQTLETLESRLLMTVPEFSSLPGANHTIFLDFDGQTVEGTSWNSYYNQTTLIAPAYDTDGNTSVFSATELSQIEDAWKRVSEDYRPFQINVTTVDPGIEALRKTSTSDQQWGIRLVVTKEAPMVTDPAKRTGAGGIAYIDSFNWSSDTPAWVFTTGGKNVAEAASHEAGHSLGLSHDGLTGGASYYTGHGSGETGWASIMGVGYYQNVTQWDRGEYYNSNNAGSTANYSKGPDDLSIITTGNGFSYRADDRGNSNASASTLSVTGTTVSGSGIVETTADIDVFSFVTGTGSVTLNVTPFTPGPNLDIKADLYDGAGTLIASSNNSAVLSAGFTLNLAGGQYFLHVDGTGWGTPSASSPSGYSDYASLGQYSISGSIVAPDSGTPQVSIGDAVVNESAGTVTFSLTLSQAATTSTSVNWATANGTAIAGSDFVANSGFVTFNAGVTTGSVTVTLVNDAVVEATESFTVVLTSPSGLIIADGSGLATINDDDVPTQPGLSINNVSVIEKNLITRGRKTQAVQSTMTFTITLSAASSSSVSVSYATKNGTATVGNNDYKSVSGTVTFSAGQTSKTVGVIVYGDVTPENNETFTIDLSNPVNATIATASGVGTILDDDTIGGILAWSERNPVMIVDAMSWFVSDSESHGEHADHDHLGHGDRNDHESYQDHQQSPLALATSVSRTALRTGSVAKLLSESPVQALQLASGTLTHRQSTLLSTPKKSAAKHHVGFEKSSELAAQIQTAANSQQDTLEVLFAEPELLQSLWQSNG